MRRFISYGPAFVVLLAAAVILAVTPSVVRHASIAQQEVQIQTARRVLAEGTVLEQINEAVRQLGRAVEPSVVDLTVTLRDSVHNFTQRSTGSGWVYDARGHIVTNAHVVRSAQRIDVQFPDGRVYAARIVGVPDVYTDIAVLRIDAGEGLFPLPRASGQPVRQGDRVFAFGSPFGFKFSMTEGIVSGTGRDAATPISTRGFTNFIQHDAAVNPGNSGGPLVDVQGRAIGMNVAIATASNRRSNDMRPPESEGQSAGISFAIPLHTIESVVGQLIESGEVRRGFMGIQLSNTDVRPGDLPGFAGSGVLIGGVTDGGPAAQAGLRRGDIITGLNGEPVRSGEVLRSVISSARPGERIAVTLWRRGESLDATVTLDEFPPEVLAAEGAGSALARFGMYIEQTNLGPIIAGVLPASPAEEAGFRAGQVILGVGQTPVESADAAFIQLVKQGLLMGQSVPLTVATPGDEDSGATTETLTVQVAN